MDKLDDLFLEHGIYNKLQSLSGRADYPVLDKVTRSLEDMDCLITSLMVCTEKNCRKLNTAHYNVSPE